MRVLLLNRCTGGPGSSSFEEIAGIPGREGQQRIKADGGGAPFDAPYCGSRSGQRSARLGTLPPGERRDDGERRNRER
jgi:hypothetical protein